MKRRQKRLNKIISMIVVLQLIVSCGATGVTALPLLQSDDSVSDNLSVAQDETTDTGTEAVNDSNISETATDAAADPANDIDSPAVNQTEVSEVATDQESSGDDDTGELEPIVYWNPQDTEYNADDTVYIYGGDDENDGTSYKRPVRTFERAKEIAAENATIYQMKVLTVEEDAVLDGGDKNLIISRWIGGGAAEEYTGIYVSIQGDATFTVKNITYTNRDSDSRQIQLSGKNAVLNIEENCEINGWLYLEQPGAKLVINDAPPQEEYKIQFADNEKFDDMLVIENANGDDITSYIDSHFELKVNIADENKDKYCWLLVPGAAKSEILAEKRNLYPGVYINGGDEGNDSNDGLSPERPVKSFERAKEIALNDLSGECVIYICDQVTVTDDQVWSLPKDVFPDCHVERFTDASGAYESGAYKDALISIAEGGSLTLNELIIDGGSKSNVAAETPAIVVNGTLNMESGSEVRNCTLSKNGIVGAGVQVKSTGSFLMSGDSKLSNCSTSTYIYNHGGGVGNFGSFTMSDQSSITKCYSPSGGSAVSNNGTFIMEGSSEIYTMTEKGTAAVRNNGTMIINGEASVRDNPMIGIQNKGDLEMNGGSISDNTIGVQSFNENAEFIMNAGEIINNSESGVYLKEGSFRAQGGLVSNNEIGIDHSSTESGIKFYLDTQMKIDDTILIDNKNNPIILTDKQSKITGDWQNFKISVGDGNSIYKTGLYSGRVIVVPSGEDKDPSDISGYASHFDIESKYRSAGYKTNIILASSVYIDGKNGSDSDSGLSPEEAVKTFEKAKEKLNENLDSETFENMIYVVNTVAVSGNEAWDAAGSGYDNIQLERYCYFAGNMIDVSGELTTADNLTFRGVSKEAGENGVSTVGCSDGTIFYVSGKLNIAGSAVTRSSVYDKAGAVYLKTGGELATTGNTVISDCSAYSGSGKAEAGGAVYAEKDTTITIGDNTLIENCTASSTTGCMGGAIYSDGSITITGNSTITKCSADNGGAIFVDENGSLTLGSEEGNGNVIISECKAIGIMYGGAVTVLGTGVMYNDCTLTAATTLSGAGNLVVAKAGSFTMEGGLITGGNGDSPYSTSALGVRVCDQSSFVMNAGEISGNVANTKAAGVLIDVGASMIMNGGVIKENKIEEKKASTGNVGGGILVEGSLILNDGTIENNTSNVSGGGIYIATTGKVTVEGGIISNNTASGAESYMGGGGIFNNGSLTFNGGIITDNNGNLGNAIYVSDEASLFKVNGLGEMDDGQMIFLEDPACPITLSGRPQDDVKYVIDMSNVFLNQVVVMPDGTDLDDASGEIDRFELSDRAANEWNFNLMESGKNIIVGDPSSIFIDGVNGLDSRDGSDPANAVRTWSRVLELLDEGKDGAVIYVVNTVTISDPLNFDKWTLEDYSSTTVKRYAGFKDGPLIHVPAGEVFTLENINIDGGYFHSIGTDSCNSLLSVSGNTTLGDGCVIQNAYILNTQDHAAVDVNAGGVLTMESGSSIENNTKRIDKYTTVNAWGAGLYVKFGGTVTMKPGSVVKGNRIIGEYTRNSAQYGTYAYGAGILCSGTLDMNGTVKENIIDSGAPFGAGIYVGSAGKMTMESGAVSENQALCTTRHMNYRDAGGGGIYISSGGSCTMNGGEVINNIAGNSSSSFAADGKDFQVGGGIANNGSLIIHGGKISGNGFYTRGTHNSNNFMGGNIFNISSGTVEIDETSGTVEISDSKQVGSNSYYYGGGLCNYSGKVYIKGGTFSGNNGTRGGAVYNYRGKDFQIDNCRLIDNKADKGAAMLFENCSSPAVQIGLDSTVEISGNKGGESVISFDSTYVSINETDIHDNTASKYIINENYDSNVIIDNTSIHNNSAGYSVIYVATSLGKNPTLALNEGTIISDNKIGESLISTNALNGHAVIEMNGAEICRNTNIDGAKKVISTGFYFRNNSTFTMNSGSIHDNYINGDCLVLSGAVYINSDSYLYYKDTDIEIKGGEIYGNEAGGTTDNSYGDVVCAGAIQAKLVMSKDTLNIDGVSIHDNKVIIQKPDSSQRICGSGAIVLNGKGSLTSTDIYGNTASIKNAGTYSYESGYNDIAVGGVLIYTNCSKDDTVMGEGTKIRNNSADYEGGRRAAAVGGIYFAGTASIDGAAITDNTGNIINRHYPEIEQDKKTGEIYITETDVQNAVGGISIDRNGKLYFLKGKVAGNGSQDENVIDYNGGYLKNGIFVGGKDVFYLDGSGVTIDDNIYLSQVGRTVVLYGSPGKKQKYKIAVSKDFQSGDVIVSPDGEQVNLAGIYSFVFSNANQKFVTTNDEDYSNVILASVIFLASYGDDHNDGSTPDTPVATYKKAVSLMKYPKHDRIYICGTVHIGEPDEIIDEEGRLLTLGDDSQNWALPESTMLKRYDGFSVVGKKYEAFEGDMISVNNGGELNLGVGDADVVTKTGESTEHFSTIVIDGAEYADTTGSIAVTREGGILNITKGVTLTNNTTVSDGAAIRNYGTTSIDSGIFNNNVTSGRGDFVFQNGKLNMKGEVTTDGDVYLGSDPENKGYYIDINGRFDPNEEESQTIEVNLPVSDSYTYRKIAVYDDSLSVPDADERAKYTLPSDVLSLYRFQNNASDERILELYRDSGLRIDKVSGIGGISEDKGFNMEIKFTPDAGIVLPTNLNYEIFDSKDGTIKSTGVLAVVNNKTSLVLKAGQYIEIKNIPAGVGYLITEEESDEYITKYDSLRQGYISNDADSISARSVVMNTEKGYGELTVSKRITGNDADITKRFDFAVHLSDKTVNGTYGGMTFVDGEANFSLGNGESITATGLMNGTSYLVTEADCRSEGYVTSKKNWKGTIEKDKTATAAFINVRNTYGDISVTKNVSGNSGSKYDEFEFTLSLDNLSINGTYGDLVFKNGVAVFKLQHGQSVTAEALPNGTLYQVVEKDYSSKGYATNSVNGSGVIKGNDTVSVSFDNHRDSFGNIKVTKLIKGNAASESKDFQFKIVLDDKSYNGTYGQVEFINGTGYFTLKANESIDINGIGNGVSYYITETYYASEGYSTNYTNGSGIIVGDKTIECTFTNTRNADGYLIVKKNLDGNSGDPDKKFRFTVSIDDPTFNGARGAITFVNGTATFYLSDGDSKMITGIPNGTSFTVTEDDYSGEGYQTSVNGVAGRTLSGNIDEATGNYANFVNSRSSAGGVRVTKIVSGNSGDKNQAFSFRMVLDDSTISGDYGELTFQDGVAVFSLKDGQTRTAENLPNGVGYQIIENDYSAEGYVTIASGNTGKIEGDKTLEAVFRNVNNKTGSLVVSKSVEGNDADQEREFEFHISVDDKSINGIYGDVKFEKGEADIVLRGGEAASAEGIPVGTGYTVSEKDYSADGYSTTVNGIDSLAETGVIDIAGPNTAEFVNTRNTYGTLVVNKKIEGNAADPDKEFRFVVSLGDKDYSGQAGDVKFTGGYAGFSLKSGESVTISGLPNNMSYSVIENNYVSEGYVVSASNNEGIIKGNETIVSDFVNTKNANGSLTVAKKLEGNDVEKSRIFHIKVKLDDTTINGNFGAGLFTDGETDLYLKGGAKAVISGLPDGVGYTVSEEDYSSEGYVTSYEGENGIIDLNEAKAAVVTNSRSSFGSITVTKQIQGTAAELIDEFQFKIALSDTSINGDYDGISFINGVAGFKLRAGESITINNLPNGAKYTVSEADYSKSGYVTVSEGSTGVIAGNDTKLCTFINTRNAVGSITVIKTLSGNDVDRAKEFKFIIDTNDHTMTGIYGNLEFENGHAEFTLKGGQNKLIDNIPEGVEYTVEEADYSGEGYVTIVNGTDSRTITGTVTREEPRVIVFNNTRNTYGDLTVRKFVDGSDGETDRNFDFTVTVSDRTVNGTYGDVEFTDGTGSFSLKHGESVSMKKLPNGITYRITEDNYSNDKYVTTSIGDSGVITGNTERFAEFTNSRDLVGSVTVSKVIDGNAADSNKEFGFTIKLNDDTINGKYECNGVADSITFSNGEAEFKLKGGESITILGIHQDLQYSIMEEDYSSDGYVTSVTTSDGRSIDGNKVNDVTVYQQNKKYVFTNTRDTYGNLVIRKTVTGGEKDREFHFTVRMNGLAGTVTYGDVTFVNGLADISLKDGESITISGVPNGQKYEVKENDIYIAEGYLVSSENEIGEIEGGSTVICDYYNCMGDILPDTGGPGTVRLIVLGAILMAISIVVLIVSRRRYISDDN